MYRIISRHVSRTWMYSNMETELKANKISLLSSQWLILTFQFYMYYTRSNKLYRASTLLEMTSIDFYN